MLILNVNRVKICIKNIKQNFVLNNLLFLLKNRLEKFLKASS